MSTQVPPLLDQLVDDAAVFPPGSATLSDAVEAHRRYHAAWYADLVGPLLVPVSALERLTGLLAADEVLEIGLIVDVPIAALRRLPELLDARLRVRRLEAAVAKRGEDPQPGLADLLEPGLADLLTSPYLEPAPPYLEPAPSAPGGGEAPPSPRTGPAEVYAEVPLTWGLLRALDTLAEARATGRPVAAKFRTGGLAAELFPTPVELAAVICACRDRELPFKLTAGLHHAVRHTDSETGLPHHGFVNVLAATALATDGAEVAEVAELLATTDPVRLVEPVRQRLRQSRPLWVGFGSCSISEPLTDLVRLGLVNGGLEQ